MLKWLKIILIDAVLFGFLIAGLFYDFEFGRNSALFYCWAASCLAIIVFLASKQESVKKALKPISSYMQTYHNLTDAILIVLISGFGWYWTASAYVIGKICMSAARSRADEYHNKQEKQTPPE